MALNRFYFVPLRSGINPATHGYATAQEAGAAAQAHLLNEDAPTGTKVAVVKLVAVVELDNPVTKSTLADNM